MAAIKARSQANGTIRYTAIVRRRAGKTLQHDHFGVGVDIGRAPDCGMRRLEPPVKLCAQHLRVVAVRR